MLVLFLLVSAPLSALAQTNDEAEASIDQTHEPVTVSEAERLATAASHWHLMPSAVQVAVEMAPSSGVLRLASGSFDPLLGDGPEVPTSFTRLHDASYTGMVLIQLDQADGNLLDALVKQHDLTVLDVVHDEGWLVRLPDHGPSGMDELRAEDGVRWVGELQPGWRVSPELLYQPARAPALAVVPTPDLGVGGYAALATDMVRFLSLIHI